MTRLEQIKSKPHGPDVEWLIKFVELFKIKFERIRCLPDNYILSHDAANEAVHISKNVLNLFDEENKDTNIGQHQPFEYDNK